MDLTPLFRVICSEILQRDDQNKIKHKCQRHDELPSSICVFSKQCQSVLHELTELENCIDRYRRHTMALGTLFNLGSVLTSNERTALNKLIIGVIRSCETTLLKLDGVQSKLAAADTNRRLHCQSVLSLLRLLLCRLTERHSSLNAQTYDRIVDLQQCCKLRSLYETNRRHRPPSTGPNQLYRPIRPISIEYDVEYDQHDLASLELEKQTVHRRLQTEKRDVEQVEQKLSTLSQLQKTFAENVLCQEESVLRISHSAAQASDSVLDSNKFIKKAMHRQTTTRTWFIFVILVLTLTLWFLHLYNP